jgi:hypothetical protein
MNSTAAFRCFEEKGADEDLHEYNDCSGAVIAIVPLFATSDGGIFALAYFASVASYPLFASGAIEVLHSRKAFGAFLALGVLVETGL